MNPTPDRIPAASNPRPPLRLWPAVALVALMGIFRFLLPLVLPDAGPVAFLGAIGCALAIFLWWLFLSRAPWPERIGVLVLLPLALLATKAIVHPSIAGGAMGFLLYVAAIPVLALALVLAVFVTRRAAPPVRRATLAAALIVGCGVFALLRTGGLSNTGGSDFHWRWTPTPEERLLAQGGQTSKPAPPALARETPPPPSSAPKAAARWPGFRGPNRDGIVPGVRIETDWSASPPTELWRRPVGPGWSSFAVEGNLIYTQEQRGDDELVSCYQLATGAPVWSHADAARFYESNAGPGPRGTPTLHDGRVYTLGATGILNALDARTGARLWSRSAPEDTKKKLPGWGFSSSPLVVGDLVIAATAGKLAAYDLATGSPRWLGAKPGSGYSSPHLATLHGVQQVLLLNGTGALGVAPADGAVLWEHEWKSDGIVQPIVLADGDVLLGSGSGLGVKVGVRRIAVARSPSGWTTDEKWTSNRLKPYFNDFVVHAGHAYGFDGSTLACLELGGGERKWKGGRYGQGQLLLLADQDALLVLSEQGELALVRAAPDEFKELARLPALQGKTWNHPVLAGDVLLVRNDHEMAAFRLKLKANAATAAVGETLAGEAVKQAQ